MIGKKNDKERSHGGKFIGVDLTPRAASSLREDFQNWFSFDDVITTSRSLRSWARDIEELMTRHVDTLLKKSKEGDLNPIVYGWSLKIVDGKPEFKEFGNVKTESVREPVADVLSTDTGFTVVVELPGVDKTDIKLETTATELFVDAVGTKKYQKAIPLPEEINQESVTSNFKNGILTIVAKKSSGNKRRVSVL